MVFFADRLFDYNFHRNDCFNLFTFPKTYAKTKNPLRNLADGLHLSDCRFGFAAAFDGIFADALFAGGGIFRAFRGMRYLLAGISRT